MADEGGSSSEEEEEEEEESAPDMKVHDDDDDDDYPNSVPERYRSVFFLHNLVDMPKELCPMFLAFDIMTKKWVKNCTGA